MVKSATHLLQAAPGVRLWLAKELAGAEDVALWLANGEELLEQRAATADAVIGGGRGSTRRVLLGGSSAGGDGAGVVDQPGDTGDAAGVVGSPGAAARAGDAGDAGDETTRAGVWRINRHGGLLGGVQGDRYRTPARLQAEIELSEALRSQGIPTPQVLLALAVKHGLSWRQHLVTAEVDGAVTVFDARQQPAALEAADQLLDQLCEVGLWATDLHPGNMLWQESSSSQAGPSRAGRTGQPGQAGRSRQDRTDERGEAGEAGRCWVIDLAGAKLLPNPLTAEQRLARRKRFARYFAKHGGEIPARFAVPE
jgi:hypothetical protein